MYNVLCCSICTALDLVSSRNIEELVLVLRKEVAKTHNVVEHEDTGKYRQLLVRTLHTCCIKVKIIYFLPILFERFFSLLLGP
jgi:coatomer subunit beta